MFLAALALATAIDAKELETLVDRTVAAEMAKQQIPGAAFILVQNGRVVLSKGYGPITPDTIVPIASITKVFTALAVVKLGIDLNADVNRYLTSVKVPPGPPVTARHLLTHTAGFDELRGRMLQSASERVLPLGEFLKTRLVRVRPPGVLTSYSSFGMTLAGALVEDVSDLPYERFLVTRIWAPLKMNRTQITIPDELLGHRAAAFEVEEGKLVEIPWERYHSTPASSISSTANDMGRFLLALLRDDPLAREEVTMHPRLPGFGYVIQYSDTNGQRILEHGGNIGGFHSLMVLLPEHDTAFFVVASREGADLRSPLRKAILDRWFPNEHPAPPPVPDPKAVPRLQRFAGTYRGTIWCHTCEFDPQRVFDVAVTVNADGSLQSMDDRWIEVEPRFFRSADGSRRIGFAEDAKGNIIAMTAGSWLVYERLESKAP
jgi:CubicO group peptidase (beta-lactamase class C family)